MGQILAFVAATASISGVMLGLVLRSMSALRNELSSKIDGSHHSLSERIDGLRNEMNAKIDGLRFEMNARLEPLKGDVDRLDQDVRELKKEISNSVKPQLT
jgi:outer membrane cobalamin receptor